MRQFVFPGKCQEPRWWFGDALRLDSILPPTPCAAAESSLRRLCSFPSHTGCRSPAGPSGLCSSAGGGRTDCPQLASVSSSQGAHFRKAPSVSLPPGPRNCTGAPVSRSCVLYLLKTRASLIIPQFPLSPCRSGSLGEWTCPSVIGVRLSSWAEVQQSLSLSLLPGSVFLRWWAWPGSLFNWDRGGLS